MANFRPFKRYILYSLDQLVRDCQATGPFLDVGCGSGDVSVHLAARHGWSGRAIDASPAAVTRARAALAPYPLVDVDCATLDDERGRYGAVVMFDVLEHLDEDERALRALATRVQPGGHVFLTTPSNPREWRWDDDLYGHVRRYPPATLTARIEDAGLELITLIDISYPIFWALRRGYTRLLSPRRAPEEAAWQRTLASTSVNAYHIPIVAPLLERGDGLWDRAFAWQYRRFRTRVDDGCELMVIARRSAGAGRS